MTQLPRAVVLLFSLTLLVAACGTDATIDDPVPLPDDDRSADEEPTVSGSFDGAWVLVSGAVDGAPLALDDQWRVTMTIDGSNIGGQVACNSYGGSVSIVDGAFSVSEVAQTEMACAPHVMAIESAFLQGFLNVTSATTRGQGLQLDGPDVELGFELLPPVATADLLGTTWVLATIVQGDVATSTIASADEATLLLDADGTFTGGTGCRTISGDYLVSGDTIRFTSFAAEGECPDEIQSQDGRVITVLEGPFTVEINGERLTLTSPEGEGLSYRADR